MNNRTIIKLVVLLFIVLANNNFAQSYSNFSEKTISSETIELDEAIKKGPVLISFWALWCKPCREELRHLENIYNKYREKGFTIIGINQDSPRSLAKVKSYISSHKITFPNITDPDTQLFQEFNGQSIPYAILFNKNKEVVYSHIGYIPGDEIELEEEIKTILGIKN